MKKNDDGTRTLTEQECVTILQFVQDTLWYVANYSKKPTGMVMDENTGHLQTALSMIEDSAAAAAGVFGLKLTEPKPEPKPKARKAGRRK